MTQLRQRYLVVGAYFCHRILEDRKMKNIRVALALICGLWTGQAKAQIVVSPTMNEAIQAAKSKSETLKTQQWEVEKLKLQRKSVKQMHLPHITASGSYLYFDSRSDIDLETLHTPLLGIPIFDGVKSSATDGNLAMAALSAKMVLFSGMQIPYGAKALEYKKIGTEQLSQVTSDELIQEVIVNFDKIRVLDAVQQLIDESGKRLEMEKKRVERSIEEGFAIPLDRDKITLAQLELQSKQLELDGNRRLLFQNIQYLTGYSEEQILLVANELHPFLIAENEHSVDEKPELKALSSFVKAKEFALKKEKGTLLPQVALVGGVRYTSWFNGSVDLGNIPVTGLPLRFGIDHITLFPTMYVGVGAQWNIFNGFQRKNNIRQAQIDIQTTESKLSDAKQKFNLLLNKNLENYRVANEKMSVNDQKVSVAKNNLNIATKQYKEGLIDISERLQIEDDYNKAVIEQVQGIQQQRQTAIEVIKTTGKLANYSIQ